MRPRLYLLCIFFLLFSATSYISSTSLSNLKSPPFLWNDDNINIIAIILTLIQFFSIFLGGFLAAFIIPVWVLIVVCFASLIIGVSLFEVTSVNKYFSVADSKYFTNENYVVTVVAFFVLFGIYSGMSKFIFLVVILDQDESTTIEYAIAGYMLCINLSYLFVFILLPSSTKNEVYYLYISMPLILIVIVLLLVGHWKKLYNLDSIQINIVEIIHRRFLRREISNIESVLTETSSSIHLTRSIESNKDPLLSISRLCLVFIVILPCGICESQLRTTFILQSNFLLQPKIDYYAMKNGFWVQIINCSGVIIFIPLLAVLKESNKFVKTTFSKLMPRIITSNLFMFLSILSAAILETTRLHIYWGSKHSTTPSKHARNQIINNTTYSAADMSVFFMTPQLLFSSVSEIILITTCVQFMYQQSVSSIKHLAVSFFLGAVGSGGAGDLISLILTIAFNKSLFDPLDLNKRTMINGTFYESRIDSWFYCLAIFFFIIIILTAILLSHFKHFHPQGFTTFNNSYSEND